MISKLLVCNISNVKQFFPDRSMFKRDLIEVLNTININEILQIIRKVNNVYPILYPNPRTQDVHYSIFRQIIKQRSQEIYLLSLKELCIPFNTKEEIIKVSKERVFEKNSNRTEISINEVSNIVNQCINSDDIFKKALALCIVSGARPIELYAISDFIAIDNTWIIQDLLAKKREHTSVKKPILFIGTKRFIEELSNVRGALSFCTKDNYLVPSINSGNRRVAYEVLGSNFYTSRKIYALISYELYSKRSIYGNNPSLVNWISKVLGHNSTETAQNYSNFSLK